MKMSDGQDCPKLHCDCWVIATWLCGSGPK